MMFEDEEDMERMLSMRAKVKSLFRQIEDEEWDVRFLITSVLFHQACRSIGLSADGMCEMIRKIDERENTKKEDKRTVQ